MFKFLQLHKIKLCNINDLLINIDHSIQLPYASQAEETLSQPLKSSSHQVSLNTSEPSTSHHSPTSQVLQC